VCARLQDSDSGPRLVGRIAGSDPGALRAIERDPAALPTPAAAVRQDLEGQAISSWWN